MMVLSGLTVGVFDFYSRPCGRGDELLIAVNADGEHFYSRPCGRGDFPEHLRCRASADFYSRPCGRGDQFIREALFNGLTFLLTPLREGRPTTSTGSRSCPRRFLLTPLREGRPGESGKLLQKDHFYSRPCGRGDDFEACNAENTN